MRAIYVPSERERNCAHCFKSKSLHRSVFLAPAKTQFKTAEPTQLLLSSAQAVGAQAPLKVKPKVALKVSRHFLFYTHPCSAEKHSVTPATGIIFKTDLETRLRTKCSHQLAAVGWPT